MKEQIHLKQKNFQKDFQNDFHLQTEKVWRVYVCSPLQSAAQVGETWVSRITSSPVLLR